MVDRVAALRSKNLVFDQREKTPHFYYLLSFIYYLYKIGDVPNV